MANPGEMSLMCRLCLLIDKEQVNIPIFDDHGDIKQIFIKISSCLPVKISKEDQLPKKICDGCSEKLDQYYEFRNTSLVSEKTLLSLLAQAAFKNANPPTITTNTTVQQTAIPEEPVVIKEEPDIVEEQEPDIVEEQEPSLDLINQQSSIDEVAVDVAAAQPTKRARQKKAVKAPEEEPPAKRPRRSAAVKAQITLANLSDDDDDNELIDEPESVDAEAIANLKAESEESNEEDSSYLDATANQSGESEDEDDEFGDSTTKQEDDEDSDNKDDINLPGTSASVYDQPGTSGVGKDGAEEPMAECYKNFRGVGKEGAVWPLEAGNPQYLAGFHVPVVT